MSFLSFGRRCSPSGDADGDADGGIDWLMTARRSGLGDGDGGDGVFCGSSGFVEGAYCHRTLHRDCCAGRDSTKL